MTCNPHPVWTQEGRLLVIYLSKAGISQVSTRDGTGATGWSSSSPVILAQEGQKWSTALPGPGAALAIPLPKDARNSSRERLLFCAHYGAYVADAVFFSDDGGSSFTLSNSTKTVESSLLQRMDECQMTRLTNGSLLLILRNNGGYPSHDPRGRHNRACADGGMCKAFSRSDDNGETWSKPDYFSTVRSGSCQASVAQTTDGLFIGDPDSDVPPNTGRMRFTLRRSTDDGQTWHNTLLDPGRSAYSQLVTLSSRPGQIGVLWEALSLDGWFVGEMRLQWVSTRY